MISSFHHLRDLYHLFDVKWICKHIYYENHLEKYFQLWKKKKNHVTFFSKNLWEPCLKIANDHLFKVSSI